MCHAARDVACYVLLWLVVLAWRYGAGQGAVLHTAFCNLTFPPALALVGWIFLCGFYACGLAGSQFPSLSKVYTCGLAKHSSLECAQLEGVGSALWGSPACSMHGTVCLQPWPACLPTTAAMPVHSLHRCSFRNLSRHGRHWIYMLIPHGLLPSLVCIDLVSPPGGLEGRSFWDTVGVLNTRSEK